MTRAGFCGSPRAFVFIADFLSFPIKRLPGKSFISILSLFPVCLVFPCYQKLGKLATTPNPRIERGFGTRAAPSGNCAPARHRFLPAMAERAGCLFFEATMPIVRCSLHSGRNSRGRRHGHAESRVAQAALHPWSCEAPRESPKDSVRVQLQAVDPG